MAWNESRCPSGLENAPGNDKCRVRNNDVLMNDISMTEVSLAPLGPSATFDVAVIGGGPAGLSAAIAAAHAGARTALVARRAPYADNRTTALLGASIDFLQGL